MKTRAICSFFVLFTIVTGAGATIPAAFADHTKVTIETVTGSGVSQDCISDGCYTPSTVTVDVGGVVIFSNPDVSPHTFTAGTIEGFGPGVPSGEFDTSILFAGNSSKWTPDTAGEVPYYCTLHSWMTGLIIVEDMNPSVSCLVPTSGDWTITTSCTINTRALAPGNVIIQNGSVLGIPSGITLDIDFTTFNLTIQAGSGVLIKSGGTVT